mmetsp:Transcript_23741/g.67165  ORF Transcript_23741/g.67165 Transcript_23741/m.67165 type:complete len:220 (-) Transcript_23741:254-913(-)
MGYPVPAGNIADATSQEASSFLAQTSTSMAAPLSAEPLSVAMAFAASSSVSKATAPVPLPLFSNTSHHFVLPAPSMCSCSSFQVVPSARLPTQTRCEGGKDFMLLPLPLPLLLPHPPPIANIGCQTGCPLGCQPPCQPPFPPPLAAARSAFCASQMWSGSQPAFPPPPPPFPPPPPLPPSPGGPLRLRVAALAARGAACLMPDTASSGSSSTTEMRRIS